MSALLSMSLAYAGFTAVCLAMERHHGSVWGRPPAGRTATTLRAAGFGLLALAAVPSVVALGGSAGIVAWFGFLTAAALVLIVLLPYAPRLAAALGVAAPVIALLAGLASAGLA